MKDQEEKNLCLADLLIRDTSEHLSYVYVIAGDPIALARHRHKNDRTWDPQKALKSYWGIELSRQHNDRPWYQGPLLLEVDFFFDFPEKMPQKTRDKLLGTYHVYRPDLDNCIKFISDIANAILYKDDCTIACIKAQKRYDTVARTEFTIKELK